MVMVHHPKDGLGLKGILIKLASGPLITSTNSYFPSIQTINQHKLSMDEDQNGLSIPYHGTHIFFHVHIYDQPITP